MISEYSEVKFQAEGTLVKYESNPRTVNSPSLAYRKEHVDHKRINDAIGIRYVVRLNFERLSTRSLELIPNVNDSLGAEEMAEGLSRMSLKSKVIEKSRDTGGK